MKQNQPNFEAALARLSEIVRMLESGQAPLEESLALYEEGVGLVRLCNEKLDGAEKKIKALQVVTPDAAQDDAEK